MLRWTVVVLIVWGWIGVASAAPGDCEKFTNSVSKGTDTQKLKRFLETQWTYYMREFPEWATFVGYPGQDDRWTDQSIAAVRRRKVELTCQQKALTKVKRKKLSTEDKVNFDLIDRDLTLAHEAQKFDQDYMPINHLNGFQIDIVQVFSAMPAQSAANLEMILRRLEKVPEVIAGNQELMREGITRKAMIVKAFMPKIEAQLEALTPKNVEESPLYLPFKDLNASILAKDAARARARAQDILKQKVYPALAEFKKFYVTEYAPKGRETMAWSSMPNGEAWYAYMVKLHTTTNLTADEIHAIGLKEVARITSEMEKIKADVRFKGDLNAFNKFLLNDKRFKFKDEASLLAGYRDIAKRLDGELPKYFKVLPRMPYGVREIPSYQAKSAPAAHYIRGSAGGGRAGWFEVNTSDLASRTRWDMETLTMHEAVPGHHLQIALASEVSNLPAFRKYGEYTAYTEGWGLYAESLGREMGFYKDPYSFYGHLSGEMMRAVRLVVDTGMHAKGWSKDRALAYYRSQMPISDGDSEIEIDRYITWPGQALAYKVGQMKIRELREDAAAKLGAAFDVREFHNQILQSGALPMDVLEKSIRTWQNSVVKVKRHDAPVF